VAGAVRALAISAVWFVAVTAGARAAPGFGDAARYVFVPEAGSAVVEVIDTTSDQVAGTLDVHLLPRQVEVTEALAKLVAVDGSSPTVVVVDLVKHEAARVAVSVAAGRIAVSPDGTQVAVAAPDDGAVAVIDLLLGRETARIDGLPRLRDILFSGKGDRLFYAAAGLDAVGVIDVAAARSSPPFDLHGAEPDGPVALRRSPDGRRVLAQGGAGITIIDLEDGHVVNRINATPQGMIFPSATGTTLIVVEPESATVSLFRADGRDRVRLAGAPGMVAIYPAWLDSVAFGASTQPPRLYAYDLDQRRLSGEIALPAAPTRGSVTPDSQKLYLPLAATKQVLVVDAKERRVTAAIALAGRPIAAVIAGGYGICH
jgi:DNA-binding beta-propeller fold protein YncE